MDELLALLEKRRWIQMCLRTNIAKPEEIEVSATGFRKARLASNVVGPRERELREAVKAIAPMWDDDLKILVNKNVTCKPHKDRGNVGLSQCLWLGDFEGGALVFESGRRLEAKEKWHIFDGKELHWNEPHVGTKYSVILYRSGVVLPKAKLIEAARRRRAELLEKRRADEAAAVITNAHLETSDTWTAPRVDDASKDEGLGAPPPTVPPPRRRAAPRA
jgi:hypothetical protein